MSHHISVWRDAGAATSKSDLMDVVRAMSERMPFFVARKVLEAYGVSAKQGWENTLQDIQLIDDLRGIDVGGLHWALVQHICCGEKSVRIFELHSGNIVAARSNIDGLFSLSRLPRPKFRQSLNKLKSTTAPSLLAVLREPDGRYLVYGAVRKQEVQVPIEVDKLPEEARNALPPFDELIALRATLYQAYGVLWVPDQGNQVEVRVDHLLGDSQQSLAEFHQQMYSHLHTLAGATSVFGPKELFPAIKSLYEAADEGVVSELAFATTTGSTKHEKMRSKESLRKETYHVGGKEALSTDIEPYKLGVRWPVRFGLKDFLYPELHLDGALSMVGSLTPGLSRYTVRKAVRFEDYNWVRDKLLEYL